MNLMRFGKLETRRDIGIRILQRLVWTGPAMAFIFILKVPFTNGNVLFALLVILAGGALADAYRLKQMK
jgi:hypothetical protein